MSLMFIIFTFLTDLFKDWFYSCYSRAACNLVVYNGGGGVHEEAECLMSEEAECVMSEAECVMSGS